MIDTNFKKLIEGRTYPFIVEGMVDHPDGHQYIKMKDPNGVKHLIRSDFYMQYHFREGALVHCRVDHINCTGKIYIEPEHPYYKTGHYYEFPFREVTNIAVHGGSVNEMAVFEDVFGNDIMLPIDDVKEGISGLQAVRAKVIRIKKGKVFISTGESRDTFSELANDDWHLFTIEKTKTYGEKYEYFILRDKLNRSYKLRKKYYLKYGLRLGQQIKCRMIRGENTFFFEPEHPVYRIGETYDFEILGGTTISVYPEGKKDVYKLENKLGKDVLIPKDLVPEPEKDSLISCIVTDIRKSQLILDCTKEALH
jgi:hypothetical protein